MQLSNSQKNISKTSPFLHTTQQHRGSGRGPTPLLVVPAASSVSGFPAIEAAGNEGGLRGSAEDSGLPTPGP